MAFQPKVPKKPNPLGYTWNFWFIRASEDIQGTNWEDQLVKIDFAINTIQDFWSVYLQLPKPDKMTKNKQGFSISRDNILPRWEHPEIAKGGVLCFTTTERHRNDVWEKLLQAVLGQMLRKPGVIDDDEICALQHEFKRGGTSVTQFKIFHKRKEKWSELSDRVKEVIGNELGDSSWMSKSWHNAVEDLLAKN
eukprot:Sspe_Gene.27191::Locus_11599_Transcript_1_1_Confidence_1.000_Length_866::g.27191::m.27191/K03259/EIF4E; translation initiation factor 4E